MRKHESGQVLVLFLGVFMLMVCCWAALLAIGLRTIRRIHAQDTADAAALSVAVMRSRALNRVGIINALMGSMMFRVEKGPVVALLKFSQGAFAFDPEVGGQLDQLPDQFWLVYNPLVPSAQVLKSLFEGLMVLRKLYFQWGSGAQFDFIRRVAAANGMAWKITAQFPELFINSPQSLQPLKWDSDTPIVYFSSRAGLPFPPLKRGKGDLAWLRDRRVPLAYTVLVQNEKGDVCAIAAARPFNRSGPMFPIYHEPLGSGGDARGISSGVFSWMGKSLGGLQEAADWLGVSWGIAATLDYFQAKEGGWDGQLVQIHKNKLSHIVMEKNRA